MELVTHLFIDIQTYKDHRRFYKKKAHFSPFLKYKKRSLMSFEFYHSKNMNIFLKFGYNKHN